MKTFDVQVTVLIQVEAKNAEAARKAVKAKVEAGYMDPELCLRDLCPQVQEAVEVFP